jgi:integrase
VPFTDEAWEALDLYLAETGPRFSGALIDSYTHPQAPLEAHTLSRMVRRWFSLAGVKAHAFDGMSAHALRHTCAQDVLDAGADIRQVQTMLGHASVKTTEDYLRLKPPGLAEAMEGRRYADPDVDLSAIRTLGPRRVAAGGVEHACPHCGRTFRLAAGLGRHLQGAAGDPRPACQRGRG